MMGLRIITKSIIIFSSLVILVLLVLSRVGLDLSSEKSENIDATVNGSEISYDLVKVNNVIDLHTNDSYFEDVRGFETASTSQPATPSSKVTTPKPVTNVTPPTPKPTTPKPPPVVSSCPQITKNCVPCLMNGKDSYCRAESGQTSGFRGWACQNNNPGNIRYSTSRITIITNNGGGAPCGQKGGYMVFKTYDVGFGALKAYITGINKGQHSAYLAVGCGGPSSCTLNQFFTIYAPSSDGNKPLTYAKIVGDAIEANPETTTLDWVVKNKLTPFALAIQKHEGFFVQ